MENRVTTPPPPSDELTVALCTDADVPELLVLQRCCWVQEAVANDSLVFPALHESLADVLAWSQQWTTIVVRRGPRLVAAVRARSDGSDWHIGRLMVAPDLAGQGVGSWLLRRIEALAGAGTVRYTLIAAGKSERNIAMYERAGYHVDELPDPLPHGYLDGALFMTKPRNSPSPEHQHPRP